MITGFIVGPLLAGAVTLALSHYVGMPWWGGIFIGLPVGAGCMLASLRWRLP